MNSKTFKRYISLFMAVLITLTSFNIPAFEVKAASGLTLHYASSSNTGPITEFGSSYNHGRAMYGIIDNEAAYCMNYGKSADGGQSMDDSTIMQSSLSDVQKRQLLYCMYYGHSRNSSAAPTEAERNEFLATQAMVWIIEAGIFGTGSDDSAASKVCASAPDGSASYSFYSTLKNKMSAALNQKIPSFTSDSKSSATTIELEWNEDNSRYEKTLTDSNGVLVNFDISVDGISKSVSGNKVTFYTKSTVTTAETATFQSNNSTATITGSCIYWTTNKSGYQEFVSTKPSGDPITAYLKIKTEDVGYGELYKKDESTGVPLKGAVYGLYKNKACTNLVEKLTTDAKGYAKSSALTAGTYYLKELEAPNKYVISDTVHTLTVTAGKTTTINATDKEQLGSLTIYKEGEVLTSWNGTNFVYEKKKLSGATFKITAGAAIYRADGTKVYSKGDVVKSSLVTGSDGSVTATGLHLGTYEVTETAVPNGYTLNTTSYTVEIEYKGQEVEVSTESTSILNTRQKAEVSVTKQDVNTKVGLPNGEYSLYASNDIKNYSGTVIVTKGTLLQTIKTGNDGNGSYTIDLPINNSYYIKETKAPNNYFRNSDDVYSFTFSYLASSTAKTTFSHTFSNRHTTAKICLQKLDKELQTNVAQGDATLEGAVYGLYARNAISHPDGKSGILYQKNALVAKLTTDKDGRAEINNLYLGDYYIKEIEPPEGYLLDEKEHNVTCNYEGDLVAEIKREAVSEDQVKKQPFQLIKVAGNGETDIPLLEGAGFTAYLVSSLTVKEDGTYDFDNATPIVLTEDGKTEMFTDAKGYAVSIPIPYGTYIVRETTTPHNYTPVKDFIVRVTEHKPKDPQVWRVLLDEEFSAKLKIIKVDSDTQKSVLKKDTEFRIFNLDTNEYVVQYTTYPNKQKHTSFFTDEAGTLILPEALKIGNYRIEETNAPYGYVLNVNYYEVAVDSDTMYLVDGDTNDVIITVEYENELVVGELTVEKKGELLEDCKGGWFVDNEEKEFLYREAGFAGAEFDVYAAEDIYTQDLQTDEDGERTKYYSEGELVGTMVTGDDGTATLSGLPLGSYYVVETKAPDGHVLNTDKQKVTFVYLDQETPVVYSSTVFENDRQKAELSVLKLDEETGLPIAGAEFGLYAAEDILNADGETIVEADTLLATAVSGSSGLLTFEKDLPFGKYYAKEIKAPAGYVSDDSQVEFDFSYQGQETAVVELVSEFANKPTTVSITKTDITSGAELTGATMTVLDENGDIVDTWTSDAEEPHVIKNLHAGKTYTLREEFAPYGYLQATDITFTVEDTGEVQHVEMQDEVPTGTIIIDKDGEFLLDINLVKGKWYEFIFDYFKDSLAGVTFELYAAEDIVSPDGLNTIYYEKDQLITELVTDGRGIAYIQDLPLGTYYLIETKTLEGFILDQTPIYADLNYIDQDTDVVYAGMNVSNERQKVEITVVKKDANTDDPLEGAVFGLYAEEDIVNSEGTLLVEKGSLIECAVSGKDGTCVFTSDLPLGRYYVEEISPPDGYASSNEMYAIDATYQGDKTAVLMYTLEFKNKPTKVKISKTDITGDNELPGAKLTIMDEKGSVIESWTSVRKPHLIEKLPIGKYTLREEIAPYGYTIATDVEFEVKDTGKIQKVKMKDEVSMGKLIIHKVDENTKNPIAGVEFELRSADGEVLETLVTDKNGYAESKALAIGTYKDGKFKDPITYTLVETKAAENYILDETPQEIIFEWDEGKEPVIEVTIELTNKTTVPKLPQTGQIPLLPICVAAGAICIGGAIGLTVKKRKK